MRNIARVDMDTGAIINEPPFVKAYIGHLARSKGITKTQTDILYFLVENMNYDNCVSITKKRKSKFIQERKIVQQTYSNSITSLAKAGFIDIEGGGQYFINPDYFTKRDWTGTKALRASWTFGSDGVEFNRDIIDENGDVIIEGE